MGAFQELQSAIDEVAAERAGLDDAYARQRADIESQYQLTETEQERGALEQLLGRLDNERDEAVERLGRGYDQARSAILERQQQATGAGAEELNQMASTFEQTYARIAGANQQAARNSSLGGLPTGGTPRGGVEASAATAMAGLAAASQARNAINEEDIAWLADKMLAQRGAGIGDAQRTAMRVGGRAQTAHNDRVANRINQERLLQADAFQGLDARFDQRSDALLGMGTGLGAQLAQMREQARQFDAQMAEQRAARAAAAARSSGGGGSRSSGGGGGSGGPTAAGLGIDEEELEALAWDARERLRNESVRGVNLSPGSGGLPSSVGVRGGQPYVVGGRVNENRLRTTNVPRGR